MNNTDHQEYIGKFIITQDNKLGKIIEEENDDIIILLKDQNGRNLIDICNNSGIKIKTKKNLVTILDKTKIINEILDERLVKITKKEIITENNNISYEGLILKANMNKIMQIIFKFVAKKNYDEFYPLYDMNKDIENEFIQEFEKELGIQINGENCLQFIRLLESISGGGNGLGNISFFNTDIYLSPENDKKDIEGEDKYYAPKNNLNSFVQQLSIYINLKYNTKRKKIEFKHDPSNPALYNQKPKILKSTGRDFGLLHK